MKNSKLLMSAIVVASVLSFGSKANASQKPVFNIYHSGDSVVLRSNVGKTMYHIEAVQDCVNKFGQFKTRRVSCGVYFVKPGNDTIISHSYKYSIINDNWKNSRIYVSQLSNNQVYKFTHNRKYSLKGVKNTLQSINY